MLHLAQCSVVTTVCKKLVYRPFMKTLLKKKTVWICESQLSVCYGLSTLSECLKDGPKGKFSIEEKRDHYLMTILKFEPSVTQKWPLPNLLFL